MGGPRGAGYRTSVTPQECPRFAAGQAHLATNTEALLDKLSQDDYDTLTAGARVLSQDRHGPKVFELADGSVLKLFRRKRLLSTALLYPYATRFARAAEGLTKRGIRCVKVTRVARVPSIQRDVVGYGYLPGNPLRAELVDTMGDADRLAALLRQQARYAAELHDQRIYFRAIHFNNVIVCPDGELGLIDISEARLCKLPLGPTKRARNFRPMVKYDEDRAALQRYGVQRFVDDYLEAARMTDAQTRRFRKALAKVDPLLVAG